ncbi:DNA-formamidopyrimidine glycosylase [Candidatus Uhrbacteria bacterium CG_4_9_14_0_2_um_filter_41_50]|uniref:Formamidopyrimidine-DNA glycosylase n=1 Tax=Candidatus Uhrbacteria bacterium CG_4_9_14_0_2_um_filter_41_50 TaxID=1975031 RepID=A0A2M8ENM8_9BACT|nr:MAG: DNA-formamidopyrimidine glycosylase [Candidatus Uhrbacteria bacterium CG_4_10_14_3_um_filter_41_21]PIZ54536.1 MAG: DNA-formamidopyrimidine glycosylase [Candidatus Uhrbacteria bacterium CG_4_10_14_0_2_um_filter_41_21]PJB84803.1 MAG: DNA-formamidopyrimidine glycosylase [Candidatus Uhrbacteria bacterium CG_4_9_14_0_8_um_filter_41_16]PJC24291.1 MAG: DNA-formamidopyrimidine glycosylase [Candidatus Uhrbacteria bacterium CG_4_9_14_0_2_um_filter_41_50]PJE74814.1 MAG: DNA-formamidopyrimidine gly
MPELPEVETIRRGLQKAIIGKTIDFVEIKDGKPLRGAEDFEDQIKDQITDSIERVGKLLLIKFESGLYLAIHLKMTGQLIYQDKENEIIGGHEVPGVDQNKYTRVIFNFTDRSKLYFNDLRKFGYIELIDEEQKNRVWAKFGPDPTNPDFSLEIFIDQIKNRKASIKSILLNQQLIAGIGNIYADEACFAAKIRPDRATDSLTSDELGRLSAAIVDILNKAVEVGGTTFRNYVGADGKRGNYSDLLCVYGRAGLECLVCGSEIQKQKTAGRGTHYCPACQK